MKYSFLFLFISLFVTTQIQAQSEDPDFTEVYRYAKKAAEDNGYTFHGYMKLDEYKNSKTLVQNIGPRTEVKVMLITNADCNIYLGAWDDKTTNDPIGYTKAAVKNIGKNVKFQIVTFLTKDKAQDILFKMELVAPCKDIMTHNTRLMIHYKKY
ncbi:MAG TPA: hypothetical protein PLU37_06965 [Chitinophagaceae bacterium]|mgnify:CR=1 FL=1|nr:hypothetical protein [Chitinophagaceae bacterium]MCB9056359.1 hypothetical protein [Chitinophagales bacterium]HPG11253.1 hypothetical protein [Chitinophagaceae bacterium]HRX94447.1 hypothetical protein [Chitinophagaceae bacterium]